MDVYQERTTSFWWKLAQENNLKPQLSQRSTEDLPKEASITIIGAGMSGVSIAYWLTKLTDTHDILLIDAYDVCSGATGRNGGHCWPHCDVPDKPLLDYQMECRDLILNFLKEEKMEEFTEFATTGGFAFQMGSESDEEESSAPHYNIQELTPDQLKQHEQRLSMNLLAGEYNPTASQFVPIKMVYTLLQSIKASNRVNVQPNTPVTEVVRDSESQSLLIKTARGVIKTKKVIYATNAYTSKLIPELKDIIVPVRGQVIATSPLPPVFKESLCPGPYDYLIQRADGRVVFGGQRNNIPQPKNEIGTWDDTAVNPLISELIRKVFTDNFGIKILPNTEVPKEGALECIVEAEWTGIMGFTSDFCPLVGLWKGDEVGTEYLSVAFNGTGMTMAFKAAQDLVHLILKTGAPPAVFDPHRTFGEHDL